MNKREIESQAIRIIESINNNGPDEDDFVEIKRQLNSDQHYKIARRIAAHANKAKGNPILWLVGVDEEDGIIGASKKDYAQYFPQVYKYYQGNVYPESTIINVHYGNNTFIAIKFDTDNFPYVVKNPESGKVKYEIPWRYETGCETAKREQLIQLFRPHKFLPKFEFGDLDLFFKSNDEMDNQNGGCFGCLFPISSNQKKDEEIENPYEEFESYGIFIRGTIEVEAPHQKERLIISLKKCKQEIIFEDGEFVSLEGKPSIGVFSRESEYLKTHKNFISINGPGTLRIKKFFKVEEEAKLRKFKEHDLSENISFKIHFSPKTIDHKISARCSMKHVDVDSDRVLGKWSYESLE